jgi:hypothetical protein
MRWDHATTRRSVLIALALAAVGANLAQAEDPFQSAPGPAAARPAHPRVTQPAPEAAVSGPAKVLRWDGVWMGNYQCPADRNNQVYAFKPVIQVRDGRVAGRLNSPSLVPDTPGYQTWSGTIAEDGSALIERVGLSTGQPGTAAKGTSYHEQIRGRFDGDSFVGKEVTGLPCELRMTRVR